MTYIACHVGRYIIVEPRGVRKLWIQRWNSQTPFLLMVDGARCDARPSRSDVRTGRKSKILESENNYVSHCQQSKDIGKRCVSKLTRYLLLPLVFLLRLPLSLRSPAES